MRVYIFISVLTCLFMDLEEFRDIERLVELVVYFIPVDVGLFVSKLKFWYESFEVQGLSSNLKITWLIIWKTFELIFRKNKQIYP